MRRTASGAGGSNLGVATTDVVDRLEKVADAFSKGRAQEDHGMRIPADREHDGDFICWEGAREIRSLRAALAEVRSRATILDSATLLDVIRIVDGAIGRAAAPAAEGLVEVGEIIELDDGLGTRIADWNDARNDLPAGTRLYAAVQPAAPADDGLDAHGHLRGEPRASNRLTDQPAAPLA